jgi:ABC-type multidrug transport system ATPase subunit
VALALGRHVYGDAVRNKSTVDSLAPQTTLLNVLAGRYDASKFTVEGFVRFEAAGDARGGGSSSANVPIGFVTQNDFLLPFLTVRETLQYAAALRMPRGTAYDAREKRVTEVLLVRTRLRTYAYRCSVALLLRM